MRLDLIFASVRLVWSHLYGKLSLLIIDAGQSNSPWAVPVLSRVTLVYIRKQAEKVMGSRSVNRILPGSLL